MAQNPNQCPSDVISVPSSTVGPNTQETLNYQRVENYTGPPIIHGSPRPDNEQEELGKAVTDGSRLRTALRAMPDRLATTLQ
eukprot:2382878-Amphidinium_carterae.1